MTIRLTDDQRIKVLNSVDVFRIMKHILLREKKIDRDKEHFWIVCLAQNNQILLIELISLGSVNRTVVEPMEVFSFALQKRAVKMILVHNHPSGELKPSPADIDLTDKMTAIGKFLRLPIIDHLIISTQDYYSFTDSGLLAQLEAETTYDLTFAKIEEFQRQIKKRDQQIKKAKKEVLDTTKLIALGLLKKGLSVEDIMETTGLTKRQVQALAKKVG